MAEIIGRGREIQRLDKLKKSKKSEFVAVYGRRRVGKTFLIREYFHYNFDFQLTGLANANTQQQLVNFHTAMQKQSPSYTASVPQNWFEAFQSLMSHLESISEKRKKIIFLDELPWLDTSRSDFLMALEHYWNSWATNRKDIILITCGSAASWMLDKLINNHGGLHNRVTERIRIESFTLKEAELLLQSQHSVLDRYQIIQLYMVMGGIPFYLEAISPEKSAAQNIEEMCFRKGGILESEFKHLFPSLFKRPAKYEAIVNALATKAKGLTRSELLKATRLPSNGNLTKILNELEESGFVTRYTPFNKKKKDSLYQLSDFYSLFYLRFIKNNADYDGGTWLNAIDNPSQRAWAGYAFEQVCLAHIPQIKKALGISGVLSKVASWKSQTSPKGVQIDLLIDRRDQLINLCEIKYSINPFTITKAYSEKLRNKIAAFRNETKTRKAVFLTMITTYGLTENMHSASFVQNSIDMDALFE